MNITLVDRLTDAKARKQITEGTPTESFEKLDQTRLYSARFVREGKKDIIVGAVHPNYLEALASNLVFDNVYVCDLEKAREDSQVIVPIPGNQIGFTATHFSTFGLLETPQPSKSGNFYLYK